MSPLTETVLDASRTQVIRTREDGSIEDLTPADPVEDLTPAAPTPPKPARRDKAAASQEVNDAEPT